ncbi:MAG TPA: hypothetical protein VH414_07645 [Lichenihabitans sp.]|jgi:hypothetical protein|nr:hypothetical protein [Lichenihabitans sp.]
MSERLDAMRRLMRLQGQVKRLAEARLAEAEAERREIEAAQRDLDAFVGEAPVAGKLASLVVVQRRRLGAQAVLAGQKVDRQAQETREARTRLKIAERMAETLGAEDRQLQERKEFERLLDGMMGRKPAAL